MEELWTCEDGIPRVIWENKNFFVSIRYFENKKTYAVYYFAMKGDMLHHTQRFLSYRESIWYANKLIRKFSC